MVVLFFFSLNTVYINEFQDVREMTKRDTISSFPQCIQRKIICNQKLWFKENQEALEATPESSQSSTDTNCNRPASSQEERTQGGSAHLRPSSSNCGKTSIRTPLLKTPSKKQGQTDAAAGPAVGRFVPRPSPRPPPANLAPRAGWHSSKAGQAWWHPWRPPGCQVPA